MTITRRGCAVCLALCVGCQAPTVPTVREALGACWVHFTVVSAGIRQPVNLHYAICPDSATLTRFFPGGWHTTP